MLSCREVTRKIATEELAEAGWRERMAVWMHLLICRFCRRYARQIRALGRFARQAWTPGMDDPARLERLRRNILGPSSPGRDPHKEHPHE